MIFSFILRLTSSESHKRIQTVCYVKIEVQNYQSNRRPYYYCYCVDIHGQTQHQMHASLVGLFLTYYAAPLRQIPGDVNQGC